MDSAEKFSIDWKLPKIGGLGSKFSALSGKCLALPPPPSLLGFTTKMLVRDSKFGVKYLNFIIESIYFYYKF